MSERDYISPQLLNQEPPSPYQDAFNASSHAYSDAAMAGKCHQEALRCALLAAIPFPARSAGPDAVVIRRARGRRIAAFSLSAVLSQSCTCKREQQAGTWFPIDPDESSSAFHECRYATKFERGELSPADMVTANAIIPCATGLSAPIFTIA